MIALWKSLSLSRRILLGQIMRYGLVGLGVTLVQAAVYWVLASYGGLHSQIANFAGYVVAVVLGYLLHGRITFAQAQQPVGSADHAARGVRFVLASLLSLGLNASWVWLCVSWQVWATWTPIPAMIFVTPAIMFVVNKRWVFG